MFRPFLVSVREAVTLAHLYVPCILGWLRRRESRSALLLTMAALARGGAADRAQCHAVKETASPAAS